VPLTEHSPAVKRATALVARLDRRLATAKADGATRFFNAEHRRRSAATHQQLQHQILQFGV
jgi:hypothetical protein